jgi:hypothetical protein
MTGGLLCCRVRKPSGETRVVLVQILRFCPKGPVTRQFRAGHTSLHRLNRVARPEARCSGRRGGRSRERTAGRRGADGLLQGGQRGSGRRCTLGHGHVGGAPLLMVPLLFHACSGLAGHQSQDRASRPRHPGLERNIYRVLYFGAVLLPILRLILRVITSVPTLVRRML